MKKILIICDNINEITKMKKLFGEDFRVSGSNSGENALGILQNKTTDIAVYYAGNDMSGLFAFYKLIRQEPKTENQALIFVVDESTLKILSDTTALENAAVIAAPVNSEELHGLLNSF